MEVVAPIITPHDLLAQFLFPIPTTLGSTALEVSQFHKEQCFIPADTTVIPLNWKLGLPPGHFGLLRPLNQQGNKGITILVFYQGEIELLLHNEHVWNAGDPLGQTLVHPYFVIIKSWKTTTISNSGRTASGPDPSGVRLEIRKKLQPLAEKQTIKL